ncbi:hypothetical protein AUJ68_03755 [Candidatus Woesearchaeota archaeon CG1_02_57_44]|nr:MAG: hypothetical protein AUJ68_03755 [Candidatus Woesearchaeota archaeon CG1_02_57_44]PIN69072.1 MAG: hypothetical protein COV94_03345 [Candidatus Woesearchaeota archaeon CG11_big_fil_rev_8_21_14_0_20_57_5]
MLNVSVIGSYPKYHKLLPKDFDPVWLTRPGENLDRAWKNREDLEPLFQEAIRWAVKEQAEAGIDIVTDGEQRRGNFVLYHCQHLAGFDFQHMEKRHLRAGTRFEAVPVVTGPVRAKEHFLVDELRFTQSLTKKPVKVTMPGPLTIIDSVKDKHYGDEKKLAFALAEALNSEARALADAGCAVVQFDEPAFIREPEKFKTWGLDALKACIKGVGCATAVHICRGYPAPGRDVKAHTRLYGDVLGALAKSGISRICVEDSTEHLPLSIYGQFGSCGLELGLVNIGEHAVENPDAIAARVREVLKVIKPERLWLAPDCGLLLLPPAVAKAKLAALVAASDLLKNEQQS